MTTNKKAAGGSKHQAAYHNSDARHYNIFRCGQQFNNRPLHADLPDSYDFYSAMFGEFSRPSEQGWAVVRCCFHHPDRHPSLSINLRSGAFRCWSCGARGRNLIEFYMRLHCVEFKTALQFLRGWR